MRFSIKSRVESLIKRGRILAAIRKLQRFTKDKADHQQTFNTLNELESKFIQIEQDSKNGVLDYATFDRERSKIRSAVLDINNEIVELKETRDRKFLIWIKGIITALIITVLGILIQQWFDRTENCPTFEEKECKLLIFKFPESSVGGTHDRINQILNTNESSFINISSAVHLGDERSPNNAAFEKALNTCDADFALSGDAKDLGDNRIVYLYPYSREKGDMMETSLATLVDELKDTIRVNEEAADIAQEIQFQLMLQLIACWTECVDCEDNLDDIQENITEVDPELQVNVSMLYASYFHEERNFENAERLLSHVINSLTAPIKAWAYRGKVRDDQKKYEPAFEDYSTYLKKKPENHNVRLKRLTSVYNLVTTSGWQNRYGDFIDVAIADLDVLQGNIPNDQFMSAQRMVQELIKIKDQNLGLIDPVTPYPQPRPSVEKCDYVFQIKSEAGKNVASAVINIQGQVQNSTNNLGVAELNNVPCEDLNGQVFTVIKDGFLPYRSQITNDRMVITLEQKPPEVQMCVFRGEVVDDNGAPLFSATVTIDGLPRLRTDREGRFNTARLTCAELEGRSFTIVANGFEPYNSEIRQMEMMYKMVPDKPFVPEPIPDPEPKTCIFSGYIMGDKGPIQNALVDINRLTEMRTDAQGYFQSEAIECDKLIGNKYAVEAAGYERITEKIRGNQLKVNHTLTKNSFSYTFRGSIVNELTQKGLTASVIMDNRTLCKSDRG